MNMKDEIICVHLLPYNTGRAFSEIFLKMEVDGESRGTNLGKSEIVSIGEKKLIPCTGQIYLCGLATVSVHFETKITVAG